MKPATLITILFLAVIAVGHLLRVLFVVPVVVASTPIPMWMSVAACLFAGALAVLLWRDTRRAVHERGLAATPTRGTTSPRR